MRRRDFIAALGSTAAWPLAARAQQRAVPVIGYIGSGTEHGFAPMLAAFRKGLDEQGYAERRNVELIYRWAENRYERLASFAEDLVRRRVAVIISAGPPRPVTSATTTIPIVWAGGGDPVGLGLVASLNHPGGNLTGVTFLTTELFAKRLQLLHEFVPSVASVGCLVNPNLPATQSQIREIEAAARILGLRLMIANASTPDEIEPAIAMLVGNGVDAFLAAGDPMFFDQRDLIVTAAARYALPTVYAYREFVEAGGLMSYGGSVSDQNRIVGVYAGRILKGEKPADLPVQQSTRIEMMLNLKTAKALGIEVPTATLLRATEVIE